jgi:protein TonB
LSSSGPRWSLDPPLLPEETARALLVRQVLPKYPQPALAAGIEGTVMLRALVGKDGIVHDLKLVQGPLIFGRCAYDAVKNWRYRPYLLNGEAIEMQTLITVNFSRAHNPALANKLP